MDELSSTFGRLSTSAPEWRPGGGGPSAASGGGGGGEGGIEQQRSGNIGISNHHAAGAGYAPAAASDLNAIQVKEFVPGQAWSSGSGGGGGDSPVAPPSMGRGVSYPQPQASPFLPSAAIAAAPSYEDDEDGGGPDARAFHPNHHVLAYDDSVADQEEGMESTIPAGPVPPPPQHPSSILAPPPFRALHSLGAGDDLWRHYRDQALEACRQMGPADPRHKAVPPPYCNAYCLDPPGSPSRSSFGYPSSTFQVTSREDGHLYCLRRFDSCRTVSAKIAAAVADRWALHPAAEPVRDHPGIANLERCFVAQRAVFFVHAYVPGAKTLRERMVASLHQSRHRPVSPLLPEPLLWSCLSQLVSAVSAVHGAGLAVRSLDVHHVLVTELPSRSAAAMLGPQAPPDLSAAQPIGPADRWRLHVNCAGIADALEFETRRHMYEWQQLDLRALGQLMLCLATFGGLDAATAALLLGHTGHSASQGLAPNSSAAAEAEAVLARNYSRELHNLVMTLFRSGGGPNPPPRPPGAPVPPPSPSIRDVSRAIWSQTQVEASHTYRDADRLGAALASEYESSRVLRLLLKLGFVNERPELGPNRRWAQSGDCYVLSLFRDYVFHQADGAGYPILDLGHVVTALNKLDAGDPEKIVLASRDGVSVMVVSYADVARCLESAFHELCSSGSSSSVLAAAQGAVPY